MNYSYFLSLYQTPHLQSFGDVCIIISEWFLSHEGDMSGFSSGWRLPPSCQQQPMQASHHWTGAQAPGRSTSSIKLRSCEWKEIEKRSWILVPVMTSVLRGSENFVIWTNSDSQTECMRQKHGQMRSGDDPKPEKKQRSDPDRVFPLIYMNHQLPINRYNELRWDHALQLLIKAVPNFWYFHNDVKTTFSRNDSFNFESGSFPRLLIRHPNCVSQRWVGQHIPFSPPVVWMVQLKPYWYCVKPACLLS